MTIQQKRLVIANRGEIARRILRAAKEKNFTVAVISTPDDADALVRREADAVLEVSSFLNAQEIVSASQKWGAHLLHPGYGFLSENATFAHLVETSGMVFVGPTSAQMLALGSKEAAKKQAQACGVPTLNALFSHELKRIPEDQWQTELEKRHIFAPYLVKASGGGGGRGMRIVDHISQLKAAIVRGAQEALSAFQDDTVFVESYLTNPRHIEIQVFGDGQGGGVFFGERECSLQRRHQKVIEEAPSSVVDVTLREKMGRAALKLVKATGYRGAGTCEFLLDAKHNFYFLEMNTRLQVEHPVTEWVYSVDLVHAQLDLACGLWPSAFPLPHEFVLLEPQGVALEARILAEDTRQQFLPAGGRIVHYHEPTGEHVRVDTGVMSGSRVNTNFDSMLAKLIVHAPTRAQASQRLKKALEEFVVLGVTTNIPFLNAIAAHPDFIQGEESTHWIGEHLAQLNASALSETQLHFLKSTEFCHRLAWVLLNEAPVRGVNAIFAQQIPVGVETFALQKGERPYEFRVQHTRPELCLSFVACRFSVTEMQVFVLGDVLTLPFLRHVHAEQEAALLGSGEVYAPMAGKVFDVVATENDAVEKNQVLFIVESMKMQLEVKSTKSGILKKIYVQKGQVLPGPALMAIIE